MITKKVQSREVFYVEFTDEEMAELGMTPQSKYTIESKNGSIILTPHEEVEIDLDQLTKEQLVAIIVAANEKDQTIEDYLVDTMAQTVAYFKDV